MSTPPVGLCQLDCVCDHGVVRGAAQVQQLVQTQPQRGEQRRVEPRGRAFGELLDQVVERAAALNGSVGQAHRQAAVARVERACLGLECPIGIGTALEAAPQHRIGAAPRGSDRGRGLLCHGEMIAMRCA